MEREVEEDLAGCAVRRLSRWARSSVPTADYQMRVMSYAVEDSVGRDDGGARGLLADLAPPDVSMVDELLADRRAEAARETAE